MSKNHNGYNSAITQSFERLQIADNNSGKNHHDNIIYSEVLEGDRITTLSHDKHSDSSSSCTNPNSDHHSSSESESPGEDTSAKDEGLKLSTLSRKKKYTLLMLCVANFGAGCGFSLPAPFFPREAEKKGASSTVTGLVFSSFQLVNFFSAPIYGNFLTAIGPKFLYTAGILVAGGCSVLFGFLDQGPPGTSFIVMAFLVRIVEALGVSAFFTASTAVVTHDFPQNIGAVFAALETCIGIGMMIGPTIGGALYEVGGFGLPFWVIGALVLTSGFIVLLCLPSPESTSSKQGSFFGLLRSPRVCVTLLCIMSGTCGIGFLEPTLSTHLETFGLSPLFVGLSFITVPGLHAVFSPLWGFLSDRKKIQAPLMTIGSIICTIGFLFIGPTPLLPFLPKELWCVFVGLAMFGFTLGCTIVPTMASLVIGARDLGYPDNLDTFGLVSGLFNSVFCLGAFIGPTVGGILVDQISFEYSATVIAGFFLFVAVLCSLYFGILECRKRSKIRQEKTPLLSSESIE